MHACDIRQNVFCTISPNITLANIPSYTVSLRYSSSAVNLNVACYDKPVALSSKKIRIRKFSGMLQHFSKNLP